MEAAKAKRHKERPSRPYVRECTDRECKAGKQSHMQLYHSDFPRVLENFKSDQK